jgi:beta-lactamase regulating signal transducer with metallopeptidase domain
MLPIVYHLNSWSAAWVALLWAIVWQSMLLAGAVAVVCFLLRRAAPGVRYWLWQIVVLKLLLMPFWTLAVPVPALVKDAQRAGPAIAEDRGSGDGPRASLPILFAPEPAVALPAGNAREPLRPLWFEQVAWQAWLLLAWLLLVFVQGGRLLRQRYRLGCFLRQATPATDPALVMLLRDLAGQLGLRRVPRILLTAGDGSPFVCGLWRSALVLPRTLLAALDQAQLRQVLLHELAHLQRRDLFWCWIPELARIVYFFHPVVHWACYHIRLERELACDQIAMRLSGHDAADYAETLIQVVAHASQPAVLKAAAASVGLDGKGVSDEQEQS